MYELFTLGGGTYLVDLLNAVAAITGGGAFVTLARIAGIAGLAWALFRTAFGGSWKDNAKWILLFVAVWGAMIVPKATVRVVDRLDPALAPAVIDNVPLGLALFASLTSQVGDGLTRLTEQAFSLPDDLTYRRHGLIFGARLAAAATRMEVTDTVFARNLRAYARQCVFHALLLGHVSADDLRESTDIWSLVTATGSPSAGASPERMSAGALMPVGQDAASSAAHEGTTGNISLANTQADVHRFATLEGRQLRTSMHVDTDRYTGFAPEGAAFTVTGDGAAVMDAGAATSRIPAAGVRLSESLAVSHESRAGAAREQARHWSGEAKVGGGFDFIVKFGADGSASWRGQTFGREAWNRMTDYAEQNQVLDLWSRVAEASRRYSTASGESELKSLEESFGANLTPGCAATASRRP